MDIVFIIISKILTKMVTHHVSLERGAQRTKSKGLRARDEEAMAKFVIIY